MGHTLGKTAWVDKTYAHVWERLAQRVNDPKLLPLREKTRKLNVEEYGCGHYGCVSPTGYDDLVIKITSDPTEAHFIACALQLAKQDRNWPEGIVRYRAIYRLANVVHRNRPVFVIWREEAVDIGLESFFQLNVHDRYMRESYLALKGNLHKLMIHADRIRRVLKTTKRDPQKVLQEARRLEDWAWRMYNAGRAIQTQGAETIALNMLIIEQLLQEMENTYLNDLVGGAIHYYLEHGLLLADVHGNNIGVRPDAQQIIITDPGHAVVLNPKWAEVTVEEL